LAGPPQRQRTQSPTYAPARFAEQPPSTGTGKHNQRGRRSSAALRAPAPSPANSACALLTPISATAGVASAGATEGQPERGNIMTTKAIQPGRPGAVHRKRRGGTGTRLCGSTVDWRARVMLPPFVEPPEITLSRPTGGTSKDPALESVTKDQFTIAISSSDQAGVWAWRARGKLLR
jgi:hypothetical protein